MATTLSTTTRVLTPAEQVQVLADLIAFGAVPGSIVSQGPDFAAAFTSQVLIHTDGTLPQEYLCRALELPVIPPCAQGDVALNFASDVVLDGTNGSTGATAALLVIDRTDPNPSSVIGFDVTSPPGEGTWTLATSTIIPVAKYLAGDIYAIWVSSETADNGPADYSWSNAVASLTYDATACASVTVSPSSLDVPSGCACEPITLTVANSTGGALDGHLLALNTPTDWHTRLVAITYSGGASGIANAPSAAFIVAAWPDGGSVAITCELCPGCSPDGVYGLTVDVTGPDGVLVTSEPVTVGRGVPAPPMVPLMAVTEAAPTKAKTATTTKRKATK